MMRSILKFCLGVLLSVMLCACSNSADTYDSQGKPVRLSDYQGKWVVINYWATWCKPCLSEMPALNKLQEEHPEKVVIIGVSFDKLTNPEINAILDKYKLNYSMVSKFPLQEKFNIKSLSVLPISFIINPDGKLVKTLQGPQSEEQFISAIGIPFRNNNE